MTSRTSGEVYIWLPGARLGLRLVIFGQFAPNLYGINIIRVCCALRWVTKWSSGFYLKLFNALTCLSLPCFPPVSYVSCPHWVLTSTYPLHVSSPGFCAAGPRYGGLEVDRRPVLPSHCRPEELAYFDIMYITCSMHDMLDLCIE